MERLGFEFHFEILKNMDFLLLANFLWSIWTRSKIDVSRGRLFLNTLPLAVSLVLKSLPLAVSHVNIHEWEVTSLGLLFLSLHQILTTCCLLSMHIDEKCPIIVYPIFQPKCWFHFTRSFKIIQLLKIQD